MPTPTIDETNVDATLTVEQQAVKERTAEVRKEVVKKTKVIMKRQGQLAAHTAAFNKKVDAYNTDMASATTPEQQMAVLAAHKFPASSICLSVSQDD